MRAEIISSETIKPSSPTPNSHRFYKLSVLDKMNSHVHVPVIHFYQQNHGLDYPVDHFSDRSSSRLKKSLSETLTRYYPLAGRVSKDGAHIECNDEGVDFLVAQVDSYLEDFLKRPEVQDLNMFVHDNPADLSILLAVQITLFKCGGMAVATSMSHKVGDLSTLGTFINDWASMAAAASVSWSAFHDRSNEEISAEFINSFFPPPTPTNDSLINPDENEVPKTNGVTRRFVFSAGKLDELKELAAATSYGGGVVVENPTRVQVVTALIYKSAIKAAAVASDSAGRSSMLLQLVNFRRIVIPPLPDKSFGNMALAFALSPVATAEESEVETFHGLVSQLKEGIAHFRHIFGKSFTGDGLSLQIFEYMKEGNSLVSSMAAKHMVNPPNIYTSSSWCRFPLYKADFGWGKPIWVSSPFCLLNCWILMDTRNGDGIEAMVCLEEQEMSLFEQDEELLRFASLNRSALNINP